MRTTFIILAAFAALVFARPFEASPASPSSMFRASAPILNHHDLVHPDSFDTLIEEAFQEWSSNQDTFDAPEGWKEDLKQKAKDKLKKMGGAVKDAAKAGWKAGKEAAKDALKDAAKKGMDAAKEKLMGGVGAGAGAGAGAASGEASADNGAADADAANST